LWNRIANRASENAWSNRSGKPVKMLYVLMAGKFEPGLAAQIHA